MCVIDCRQLAAHCVLAQILRTQQLNDLDFEQIVSLHGQLSKCFDYDPHLRFVNDALTSPSVYYVVPRLKWHQFMLRNDDDNAEF